MRIGKHINLTKYLIETYNKSIGHYRLLWIKGNLYILATFVSKEQLEDAKRLDQYKVSDLEIEPWKTEKEMPFKKTRKDLLNPMANIKFERNVAYKDADEMLKTIGVSSEEQNYHVVQEKEDRKDPQTDIENSKKINEVTSDDIPKLVEILILILQEMNRIEYRTNA